MHTRNGRGPGRPRWPRQRERQALTGDVTRRAGGDVAVLHRDELQHVEVAEGRHGAAEQGDVVVHPDAAAAQLTDDGVVTSVASC